MKQSAAPSKLSFVASYLVVAILVILPFHALLTTWAGSNLGNFELMRVIKELIMVHLCGSFSLANKSLAPTVATLVAGWLYHGLHAVIF
jgi:antibiotic biosynthesis monooxygenase (ABM) superfamily enzyme